MSLQIKHPSGLGLTPAVPVNSVGQNKLGVTLNETLIQALVKVDKGCCPFFESLLREKHFKQHTSPAPNLSFLEVFWQVWSL